MEPKSIQTQPIKVWLTWETNSKPNKRYDAGRRCDVCGCLLSIYNSDDLCAIHRREAENHVSLEVTAPLTAALKRYNGDGITSDLGREVKTLVTETLRKSPSQRKISVDGRSQRCTNCGEWKPLSAFHHDKHCVNGVKAMCSDCENERIRARRAKPNTAIAKKEGGMDIKQMTKDALFGVVHRIQELSREQAQLRQRSAELDKEIAAIGDSDITVAVNQLIGESNGGE